MDLFTYGQSPSEKPLAERLRPRQLDDLYGQEPILGVHKEKVQELLSRHPFPNVIFWGPPGCGKTSLAHVIEKSLPDYEFVSVNAIDTGAKAIKELGQQAKIRKVEWSRSTILFIDEIHRLNRAQQDVLLPFTEKGDFSLIGATTENPSYELNSALLSRCRVFVFKKLELKDLLGLVERALASEKILPDSLFTESIKEQLCQLSNGDGRKLLSDLEQLIHLYRAPNSSMISFPIRESLTEVIESHPIYYDKKSDQHYDCISAFIKSVRGSDPDAGLYYLARMLAGGEDPVFIARRLVILASEDVGNADPKALPLAVATMQAVEMIGLPEAGINLAQAVTYLASAPKSNRSYQGLRRAQKFVRETGNLDIPHALRGSLAMDQKLGVTQDKYEYPHDEPGRPWVLQNYLPEKAQGQSFYQPSQYGFEKKIQEYLKWLKGG